MQSVIKAKGGHTIIFGYYAWIKKDSLVLIFFAS